MTRAPPLKFLQSGAIIIVIDEMGVALVSDGFNLYSTGLIFRDLRQG